MLYLEIVEALFPGENLFQQFTQLRYIPLPVSQLIDVAPFGFARLDLKRRVEGSVGCLDPQFPIENEKRIANRINDLLGVFLCEFQLRVVADCEDKTRLTTFVVDGMDIQD